MITPIAIIKDYAELVWADRIEDGQRKGYARTAENATTRLFELIHHSSCVLCYNKNIGDKAV